jgi:hypothetical protein
VRQRLRTAGWGLVATGVIAVSIIITIGAVSAHGDVAFNQWVGWATVAILPLEAIGILLVVLDRIARNREQDRPQKGVPVSLPKSHAVQISDQGKDVGLESLSAAETWRRTRVAVDGPDPALTAPDALQATAAGPIGREMPALVRQCLLEPPHIKSLDVVGRAGVRPELRQKYRERHLPEPDEDLIAVWTHNARSLVFTSKGIRTEERHFFSEPSRLYIPYHKFQNYEFKYYNYNGYYYRSETVNIFYKASKAIVFTINGDGGELMVDRLNELKRMILGGEGRLVLTV